ncbi:P63C domain-containing protein [Prevotella koreensis]
MEKTLQAKYEGILSLGNTQLDVAVLENGQRIIKQTAVFKALDRPARGNSRVIGIPTFMDAKNLQRYVNEEVSEVIKKVNYYDTKGLRQQGFDCLILPAVCDLYLKAREDNILLPTQIDTAQKAEILMRSLAKVGIVALVDEATGYQYDREHDELQKILKAYISEELLPWQKRFPDIFYKELFRLNGWNYTVNGIKKRPGVIGKWTNTIIYEELPKGVLEELKNKTPKNASGNRTERYHQYLSEDIGEPNLEKQINKAITLFQVSDNMNQFWSNFKKMKERQVGQLEISFEFDEKGHTKE